MGIKRILNQAVNKVPAELAHAKMSLSTPTKPTSIPILNRQILSENIPKVIERPDENNTRMSYLTDLIYK